MVKRKIWSYCQDQQYPIWNLRWFLKRFKGIILEILWYSMIHQEYLNKKCTTMIFLKMTESLPRTILKLTCFCGLYKIDYKDHNMKKHKTLVEHSWKRQNSVYKQ